MTLEFDATARTKRLPALDRFGEPTSEGARGGAGGDCPGREGELERSPRGQAWGDGGRAERGGEMAGAWPKRASPAATAGARTPPAPEDLTRPSDWPL